ncbi:perlucin-like protein [Pomacea canaliculata]|uniref:perlucin-like protein n=1 Tax=Pomacea canaliculata TaxID=400727 RepID=UPI000D72B381|nr:perlucin-like protein [Pomacea canaliculata]
MCPGAASMRSELRLTSTLATFVMFMLMFAQGIPVGTKHKDHCDNGWEHFEESCYVLIADEVNYPSSLDICKKLGGYLVEINSERENTFLRLFFGKKMERVWQGINDISQEGRWVFSRTGYRVLGTYWHKGEPNNYDNEDCAIFDYRATWFDISCNSLFPLICEKQSWR